MIRVGKFGSMFLAQAARVAGIHLIGVTDLSPAQAKSNMELVGWSPERFSASLLDDGAATGRTFVGDDWRQLVAHLKIDIIIEYAGAPMAAIEHALEVFSNGKHVINITVKADAFCGPRTRDKGQGERRHLTGCVGIPSMSSLSRFAHQSLAVQAKSNSSASDDLGRRKRD